MRTSVFSVAGSPSRGSRCRKSVIGFANSQRRSLSVPSKRGAASTRTASALRPSVWGAEGNPAERGRAPASYGEDNVEARYAPHAMRCKCLRTFFTCPCAPTQSPFQSSSVGRTFKTSLARGLPTSGSSFRIFPSRNTSTRLANCAISCSWVTRTIVNPLSFRS
jgi:hypothetical protein